MIVVKRLNVNAAVFIIQTSPDIMQQVMVSRRSGSNDILKTIL